MTIKTVLVAEIPEHLIEAWVQHVRDFDSSHADCHFEILSASSRSLEDINKMLDRIDPPFEFRGTFRKQ
jgi:hypothetical protein